MARRDDPENRAGGREFLRSKNQQAGWPFFWLLFFGHAKKSNSPKARYFSLGFYMGMKNIFNSTPARAPTVPF
jgi:hypothetical protein